MASPRIEKLAARVRAFLNATVTADGVRMDPYRAAWSLFSDSDRDLRTWTRLGAEGQAAIIAEVARG